MEAHIGIDKKATKEIVEALNTLLADEHVLYIKTRNYHWNIEGASFLELHELLEQMYTQTATDIDLIAERIRKLGDNPMGSMAEFLEHTRLKETKVPYSDSTKIIKNLLGDYESIIRWMRDHTELCGKHDDVGTEDFLTGLIKEYEEVAWKLRSYVS